MNWDFGLRVLGALYMLGSGALNLYLYFKTRTDQRFTEMGEAHEEICDMVRGAIAERKAHHAEHETRLQVLESNIESIPTHADLDNIRQQIAATRQDVAAVDERSKMQLDSLRRIENYLLSSAR